MYTRRLEASVTHSILTQLDNLGWVVDETKPECNVFQQRAKTEEQKKQLRGKAPDFLTNVKDNAATKRLTSKVAFAQASELSGELVQSRPLRAGFNLDYELGTEAVVLFFVYFT